MYLLLLSEWLGHTRVTTVSIQFGLQGKYKYELEKNHHMAAVRQMDLAPRFRSVSETVTH
jgi:hypothetical protein